MIINNRENRKHNKIHEVKIVFLLATQKIGNVAKDKFDFQMKPSSEIYVLKFDD